VFDNLASYVLFIALLILAHSLKDRTHEKPLFGSSVVSKDASEYIVAPIVIVLLVAGLYFVNIRAVQANSDLIGALKACGGASTVDTTLFQDALSLNVPVADQEIREQLMACTTQVISAQSVPGPTKQAFYDFTTKAIQDQIAATPKDARIYVLGGTFYNQINQFSAAQPLLETAHKLSPGKQTIDFQLASDYLNTGKNDEAIALLKQAYESDTTYSEAAAMYANALVLVGKEKDARTLFNNDPAIFETTRMANTLTSVKEYDAAIVILQKLITASPKDLNLKAQLAQTQYTAGYKWDAQQTLKSIEVDHPEYKTQIDAAIQQMSK
jgi:tetratricopeptide (TPR) repeat protein